MPKRKVDLEAEVLRVDEVALLLGVDPATVRRWKEFPPRPKSAGRYAGEPGCFRTPGGHLRFWRDSVMTILYPELHKPRNSAK